MRRTLAELGPNYTRADGDFERVSLPDGDGDVLRDLLIAAGLSNLCTLVTERSQLALPRQVTEDFRPFGGESAP